MSAAAQTAPKGVALVIGSGSVKCAAALGLMKVLRRERIPIDLVVGCSGGSLYAAVIALGIDVDEAEAMTKRLWTKALTKRRAWKAPFRVLFPRSFGFSEKFGLVDDRLILARLRDAFGEKRFSDAKIPLFLTATDFWNGEQVVMSEGGLVDAIRASIAIPYVFEPWTVGDRVLLDGFMSDPMPVGVAIREGAGVIVTMGFESPYQTRVNGILRFAFQLSSINSNNLLRSNYSFHNLAHHGEILPIVPVFKDAIHLFDTDKIPAVIAEGERAAEELVPQLRRLLGAAA